MKRPLRLSRLARSIALWVARLSAATGPGPFLPALLRGFSSSKRPSFESSS